MASAGRRVPEEEHVNHERWLVTYADMITLLMVLFIVLFSISQVDQKRFNQLKEGMAAGFGETSSPFHGASSVMENSGIAPIPPVRDIPMVPGQESEAADKSTPEAASKAAAQAVAQEQRRENQRRYEEAENEVDRLEKLRRRLLEALRSHGLQGDVQIAIDDRGLRVSMVSEHIVFAPNLAALTGRGVEVLDTLGPVLRDVPDKVQIDGHTNQVDVKPKYYPTDWELSSARSTTVLRHLNERGKISGSRLSAVAYAHYKPLIDPKRAGSQKLNKRVDLVVLSPESDETRALFEQVVQDRAEANRGRR